jgi:hypothetical protein
MSEKPKSLTIAKKDLLKLALGDTKEASRRDKAAKAGVAPKTTITCYNC